MEDNLQKINLPNNIYNEGETHGETSLILLQVADDDAIANKNENLHVANSAVFRKNRPLGKTQIWLKLGPIFIGNSKTTVNVIEYGDLYFSKRWCLKRCCPINSNKA